MSRASRTRSKPKHHHPVLWAALKKRRWTQHAAAGYLGVTDSTFGHWMNLQEVPKHLSVEQETKLYEWTGKLPEELWPGRVRNDLLDVPETFSMVHDIATRNMLAAMDHQRRQQTASADELFDHEELACTIEQLLEALPASEAVVIRARFFEDKGLEEIGRELGKSRERVRQLEARGLRRLRHPSLSNKIRPFLNHRDRDDARNWRLCIKAKEDREVRDDLISLEACTGWLKTIRQRWSVKGILVVSATAYGPRREVIQL